MKTTFCFRLLVNFWFVIGCISMLSFTKFSAQEKEPFYKNGAYEQGIPSPEAVLGFHPGERPVRYEEVVRYLKALAEATPRVQLVESGETHEGRKLYYALISSGENMARVQEIRENIARLADPRKAKSAAEAQQIIERTPAVAWLMYSIHGDELSGVDAGLQTAYQVAAGMDSLSQKFRRELVVGIDPIENPDGRERFLAQMQQWRGFAPNPDVQSIQHTGVWPWGRGNHFLFDLNRDWIILSQPESRARVGALLHWNPQVVVDAHEMGSYDTFLFPPAREPINPNFNRITKKWGETFAADQARAFDQYGWSYYTGEWLEDWYPGYGSSWPYFIGAVGILYEQASTDGTLVKRPDGTILTFREAVHHQFIASIANISTAANHRKELLQDYYRMKKEVTAPEKNETAVYYILPGDNPSRANRLIERLLMQQVEVQVTDEDFRAQSLRSYWNTAPLSKTLPEGTYIIRLDQPLRPLINAILEFDPRMTSEFLRSERESLERGKGTRMYEVSAWSMLMAYGVEAYISTTFPAVKSSPFRRQSTVSSTSPAQVINPRPAFGFVIDYKDDNTVHALLKLFEAGYRVRMAEKPFRVGGDDFPRGSLLLRLNENPSSLGDDIAQISQQSGVPVYGVNTARSQEGPDLGGNEFQLLAAPRIALLTGPDINMYNFGAIWYLLGHELKCRYSILNYDYFNQIDLRKYNVLILPTTWGGAETYRQILGENSIGKLKDWVTAGGTLIGIENGAAFLADSASGFSQVKLRRQALKELSLYASAVEQENKIGKVKIDSLVLWEGKQVAKSVSDTVQKESKTEKDEKALKLKDERQRLFMPRGPILTVDLDENHWLNFGMGNKVPALLYSSYAFLAKMPVQTAARFGSGDHLRLSGLLWPEAKERWENTAYLTREAMGNGQIILFAGEPNFRSYFYGTGRMLINSMLLGPGFGTRQPVAW
jgi:hypothetical protein